MGRRARWESAALPIDKLVHQNHLLLAPVNLSFADQREYLQRPLRRPFWQAPNLCWNHAVLVHMI